MQLRCTRMDTRRWQRSRSQVRQRRQCLWAAPTRHAAAPDAQPCAAGDPRARAVLWARRQAVRGVRSCAALLIGSEASLQPSHPARWEAHLTRRVAQARDGRRRHPSGPDPSVTSPSCNRASGTSYGLYKSFGHKPARLARSHLHTTAKSAPRGAAVARGPRRKTAPRTPSPRCVRCRE